MIGQTNALDSCLHCICSVCVSFSNTGVAQVCLEWQHRRLVGSIGRKQNKGLEFKAEHMLTGQALHFTCSQQRVTWAESEPVSEGNAFIRQQKDWLVKRTSGRRRAASLWFPNKQVRSKATGIRQLKCKKKNKKAAKYYVSSNSVSCIAFKKHHSDATEFTAFTK